MIINILKCVIGIPVTCVFFYILVRVLGMAWYESYFQIKNKNKLKKEMYSNEK